MKKIVNWTLVLGVILCSCGKNGLKEDCYKEEHLWAKQHMAEYEDCSRTTLAALPWTRQVVIYSGLSPEKKVRLWKEKVDIVKKEGRYPEEVVQEFEAMVQMLQPSFYSDKPSEEDNDFVLMLELWEVRLREVFDLSQEDIMFLLYKWVTKEEYYESKMLDKPVATKFDLQDPSAGENPLCECADWKDCVSLNCDIHHEGVCRVPEKACGKMGGFQCSFLCS